MQKVKSSFEKHRRRFFEKAQVASRQKQESDFRNIRSGIAKLDSRASSSLHFPIHSIDLHRNKKFFGRSTQLQEVDAFVERKCGSGMFQCAITGMGGVGKTQFALEYAYSSFEAKKFDCVLWISSETEVDIRQSFGRAGDRLGLKCNDPSSTDHTKTLNWLETTGKRLGISFYPRLTLAEHSWLLIYDNVEMSWNKMAPYVPKLPRTRTGAILLTARKRSDSLKWCDHALELPSFSAELGGDFVKHQIESPRVNKSLSATKELCDQVSRKLGGLPLFLTAAAGFINVSGSTLEEFLDVYEQSTGVWEGAEKDESWAYEKTIETMFGMTRQHLSKVAQGLMLVLAFLSPEGVIEELLQSQPVAQFASNQEDPGRGRSVA